MNYNKDINNCIECYGYKYIDKINIHIQSVINEELIRFKNQL